MPLTVASLLRKGNAKPTLSKALIQMPNEFHLYEHWSDINLNCKASLKGGVRAKLHVVQEIHNPTFQFSVMKRSCGGGTDLDLGHSAGGGVG